MRSQALFISALLLLLSVSWASPVAQPVDTYTSEFEKSAPDPNIITRQWLQKEMQEKQDKFLVRVAIPDAVKPIEEPDEAAIAAAAEAASAVISHDRMKDLRVAALFLLAGVLIVRKLAPALAGFLNARFNPWLSMVAAGVPANLLAEEKSFAEFVSAFRIGPAPRPNDRKTISSPIDIDADAVKTFFKQAPALLVSLRNLLQQVGPNSDVAARKRNLEQMQLEMRALKGMAGLPELLPIWQMACAMEGLLNQLIGKAQNVTLSTLRTAAQAIDLLELLSVPCLRPDLATNPPIRLLAVDDDPISRHAISFALKKALNAPDLAPHADGALPLCAQHLYDVIFLDVQMPGMDGFELCTKIHETDLNRRTPIVFVTCQSDFESRAKSTLVGGHDLMGKPFLTFEITVKALTLVLRGRLESAAGKAAAKAEPAKTEAAKTETIKGDATGVPLTSEKKLADTTTARTDAGKEKVPASSEKSASNSTLSANAQKPEAAAAATKSDPVTEKVKADDKPSLPSTTPATSSESKAVMPIEKGRRRKRRKARQHADSAKSPARANVSEPRKVADVIATEPKAINSNPKVASIGLPEAGQQPELQPLKKSGGNALPLAKGEDRSDGEGTVPLSKVCDETKTSQPTANVSEQTKAADSTAAEPKTSEPAIPAPAATPVPTPPTSSDTSRYLRNQLQSLTAASESDRREILAELCLGIHTLTPETDRSEQTAVFRLSSALQGLLKKLLEKPDRATSGVLETASAALNLLDEMRRNKTRPDLATPAVRIMIVDDDPVARRAITGAVQLSFAKPDSVESGEAAVASATEHAYDVIFLDVRMPGMDGFEACKKIRETKPNGQTPIVFVTSHTDVEMQKPSAAAGGNGLISKPAMAVEVTLTALTHVLQKRLNETKTATVPPQTAS